MTYIYDIYIYDIYIYIWYTTIPQTGPLAEKGWPPKDDRRYLNLLPFTNLKYGQHMGLTGYGHP